ncbi:AraC family transcriptional regulator [Humibacter antri]
MLVGPYDLFGPGPHSAIPHRHDFTELIWVHSGAGLHHIDDTTHTIAPHTLHTIARGQVHRWDLAHPEFEGTLVLFREEFLAGPGGIPRPAWQGGVCSPDPVTCSRIDRIIAELELELDARAEGCEFAVRSLLSALLVVCSRSAHVPGTPATHRAPPASLVGRFTAFVDDHPRATLTVRECAKELNVTTSHLCDAVAAATGRSPGEIIRAAILLEAERLLTSSDLTCAQVATSLAFDDPSYFSRFFRREAGMTASEFRRVRLAA